MTGVQTCALPIYAEFFTLNSSNEPYPNNEEVISSDANWNKTKQTARFVCALTIYWPSNKFINVSGKVEGTISKFKKGNNGFGYDPIFIPLNKKLTFGQMNSEEKVKRPR